MHHSKTDNFNKVTVPIFERDNTGAIKANTLFHRSHDKLHSRCIEYPFAASQLGDAKCVLDVGTVKSDTVWIDWLENLPIEVHATDYDEPFSPFKKVIFHQADIRKLPIPDESFDKVMAVSVIEHIGLNSPQVLADKIPDVSQENGDLEALKELARVLKPGGELIMTFPFGIKDELILGDEARNYTVTSIKKFENVLKPVNIEYYEYQHKFCKKLYEEYPQSQSIIKIIFQTLTGKLKSLIKKVISLFWKTSLQTSSIAQITQKVVDGDDLPGTVVWRRLPLSQTSAIHYDHVDGVVCGVWRKENCKKV